MKSTLKKALSVLIAATVIFGSFAFGFADVDWADFAVKAEAAETFTEGHYTYTVDNEGNATIVKVSDSISGDVIVPSTLGGYTVKSIGESAFEDCFDITNLTIDNNVTSIGKSAFEDCHNITNATIGDSVTTINDRAFYDCSDLSNVAIGSEVANIGNDVFGGWNSLVSITVDSNNTAYSNDEHGVLYTKDKTALIRFPKRNELTSYEIPDSVIKIGDSAFDDCINLTDVTLPDNLKIIDNGSFSGCNSLTNMLIPDEVTTIGDYAFWGCYCLTNIKIPDSVTSIGKRSFNGCNGLTIIEIPDSVTNIGVDEFGFCAFYNCNRLEKIVVDPKNTVYSSDSYGVLYNKDKTELIRFPEGSKIINFDVPEGVKIISVYSFGECDILESVTISDSVVNISRSAFESCKNLTSVDIGDSVTEIGSHVFDDTGIYNDASNWENGILYVSDCMIESKKLISGDFTIKEGTKVIASGMSGYFTGLTSVIIPNSVTSISSSVFKDCDDLTSVIFGDNVRSIGKSAFEGCDGLTTIKIPDSVIRLGDKAFYECTYLQNVKIGDGVKHIGDYSFSENYYLKEVVMGKNVEIIGDYAFSDCRNYWSDVKLSIEIPNSVTRIGDCAFRDSDIDGEIPLGEGVKSIGKGAFMYTSWTGTGNVTLPDGLTTIGDNAFRHSDLRFVKIPDSVTSIGIGVFGDLDSSCFIFVDKNNSVYSSESGMALYNKEKTQLISFSASSEHYIVSEHVTNIGDGAFEGTTNLKITLGNNVTSIGEKAFCFSKTKSIIIPKSVKKIEANAFGSALTDIYYEGTQEEWSRILVHSENASLMNATVHFETVLCKHTYVSESAAYPEGDGVLAYYCELCGGTCLGDYSTVASEPSTTKPGDFGSSPTEPEEPTTKPVEVPTTAKPVTEPTTKPVTEPTTKPVVEPTTIPAVEPTTKPVETTTKPVVEEEIIKKPSTSTVKYGETLILHADFENIPEGVAIEWSVEGKGVTIVPSEDGKTCAVTSTATGDVTITAKYVDANGIEHVSEQEIESNASFWQKIVSFFKNLFGMNRIIEQIFKF